jgi:ribosomal protein S18 acetylase RimI-like enzyme
MNSDVSFEPLFIYDANIVLDAASLHFQTLKHRSFLTNFGISFLQHIYKDIFNRKLGFFIVAKKGTSTIGFVCACYDSSKLFSFSVFRSLHYFFMILPKILFKPPLAIKVFQTFFYSQKDDPRVKSELVVIAVNPLYQSLGIGTELIKHMEQVLLEKKLFSYKVTVHNEMEKSNHFYSKNNMHLTKTFKLYGVLWNLYSKDFAK